MKSNCGTSNSIHPQFQGRASNVANPVTHSAPDFFERPSVLINFEGSHDKEVSPQVGCRGPQLDFVVRSGSRKLIDLNKITLNFCSRSLWWRWKNPAEVSIPVCSTDNTLHSLFSHAEILLNGILISTSNNAYHHSAFFETEVTTDLDSKTTWAETPGYQYQGDKSIVEEVNKWTEEKLKQGKFTKHKLKLVGDLHNDFLECEKYLLPGVTLHLPLHRSSNDFSQQSLAESDDQFMIVFERASVFVTKLILKDSVPLSIEKALINFEDHFDLVFDPTSTREASKSLTLFPELTGANLTLKLLFEKALQQSNCLSLLKHSTKFL